MRMRQTDACISLGYDSGGFTFEITGIITIIPHYSTHITSLVLSQGRHVRHEARTKGRIIAILDMKVSNRDAKEYP